LLPFPQNFADAAAASAEVLIANLINQLLNDLLCESEAKKERVEIRRERRLAGKIFLHRKCASRSDSSPRKERKCIFGKAGYKSKFSITHSPLIHLISLRQRICDSGSSVKEEKQPKPALLSSKMTGSVRDGKNLSHSPLSHDIFLCQQVILGSKCWS
jgi:hypothetical protein